MSSRTRTFRDLLPSPGAVAGVVLLLVGWELVSTQFTPYRFPGLERLANSFWLVLSNQTRYDVVENLGYTLVRILVGFCIVMSLGSLMGVYMGLRDSVEDYLSPVVTTLLTVPSVIWAFLATIWFGLTDFLVPIFVISIIIVPYVAIQMWQGTQDVDQNLLDMASAFGASESQVWKEILIPHLTPYTMSTARLAFTLSWKLSLIAEIFGANKGVGVIVRNNFLSFQTDMIIAWALPVMFITFGVERIFQYLETRAYRWQDTDTGTKAGAKVVE
jgi:NitT/TauT family transport system permease protein